MKPHLRKEAPRRFLRFNVIALSVFVLVFVVDFIHAIWPNEVTKGMAIGCTFGLGLTVGFIIHAKNGNHGIGFLYSIRAIILQMAFVVVVGVLRRI